MLQSKIALLEFDLNKSQNLLKKADEMALSKGLDLLSNKVQHEQVIFERELRQWKKYSDQNISMRKRIEKSELEKYITQAMTILPETDISLDTEESEKISIKMTEQSKKQ